MTTDLGVAGLTEAEPIGRGGFGTVYRAHQAALDRQVAVKVLNVDVLRDKTQQFFEREARALGIRPAIPISSLCMRSGLPTRVSPTRYGVRRARFVCGSAAASAVGRAVELTVKVASGLEASHRLGLLHRDVKPENVLLSAFGEPKLADFGIARLADRTATTNAFSPMHAAPEVLAGMAASVRSDIYALASSLYTLLAGHAPFERIGEDSIYPLLARVQTQPPPSLLGTVPEPVCRAVEKGLAKEPVDRPSSAEAFARFSKTPNANWVSPSRHFRWLWERPARLSWRARCWTTERSLWPVQPPEMVLETGIGLCSRALPPPSWPWRWPLESALDCRAAQANRSPLLRRPETLGSLFLRTCPRLDMAAQICHRLPACPAVPYALRQRRSPRCCSNSPTSAAEETICRRHRRRHRHVGICGTPADESGKLAEANRALAAPEDTYTLNEYLASFSAGQAHQFMTSREVPPRAAQSPHRLSTTRSRSPFRRKVMRRSG